MPRKTKQQPLLEGDIQEVDNKLLALMQRLGITALPPHETMLLPLERMVVPGAALLTRSAARLVKSIQKVGLLQAPALVLRSGTTPHDPQATFEVVLGRRRILAARMAGLSVVKCEVYASGTPQLGALLGLIENEQRSAAWIKEIEDLRHLIDEGVGMTLDDLADFGFHRGQLAERLKIARLPDPILTSILAGKVSQEVAKRMARLSPVHQEQVAELAQAWAELPEPRAHPLASNGHTIPVAMVAVAPLVDASDGALSPAQVLATLERFEPQTSANPALSRVSILIRVLIKELQIAIRASPLTPTRTTETQESEVTHV